MFVKKEDKMIKLILISTITIFIGLFLQHSSQYVSFSYNNLPIQIPTWLALTIIMIFIFLQIWLLQLTIRYWLQNRIINKSIKYAKLALFALISGNASTAERYALSINAKSRFGWLGLLIAAKAAKKQGTWDKAHKYLMKAEILATQTSSLFSFPDRNESTTFGIIKSEIYYNQGEYYKCLDELKKLHKEFPRNKQLLFKLTAVYQTLNDWQGLIKLLPTLKKGQIYNDFDYQQLEFITYKNNLEQLAATESIDAIIKCFKDLPKNIRQDSQFVVIYVHYLIKFKCYDLAEKTIKTQLSSNSNNWDINLITLYGLITSSNIKNQIKTAENWLINHPSNEKLLLALGRLCVKEGLLGKAKNYLEKSLNIQEDPDCYAELGRLASLLGEPEKSLNCFQKGLSRITKVIEL